MTNLAGHDMEAVLDAFAGVDDDQPTCFIAYTIKGYGLPFAGHKDNHAGLMTPSRWRGFKQGMGIADGAGMGAVRRPRPCRRPSCEAFLDGRAVQRRGPRAAPRRPRSPCPTALPEPHRQASRARRQASAAS